MSEELLRSVRCTSCEAIFKIAEGPKDGRIPMEYAACICPECNVAFCIRLFYPTDQQLNDRE